jgi:uncharacterized protein YndB with AHSA1/START domain
MPARDHAGKAGTVSIEGEHATLRFQRRLDHPPEAVWAALTEPKDLAEWLMASQASVEPRLGGRIALRAGPSQLQVSGRILAWDPPRVFEHEFHVAPHESVPLGERAIVRYELAREGRGTLLTLTFRQLSKGTAMGFAPGEHVLLDRLEAQLAGHALPDWARRFGEVQALYPGWPRPR